MITGATSVTSHQPPGHSAASDQVNQVKSITKSLGHAATPETGDTVTTRLPALTTTIHSVAHIVHHLNPAMQRRVDAMMAPRSALLGCLVVGVSVTSLCQVGALSTASGKRSVAPPAVPPCARPEFRSAFEFLPPTHLQCTSTRLATALALVPAA
jgi:hypothetical protein